MKKDAAEICREQIALLRVISSERAFTTEEVKNLETLVKTLKTLGEPEEVAEDDDIPDAVVLKLLTGE